MTIFIATVVAVIFTRSWRFHFRHSHNNSVISDNDIAIAVVELSRSCQWQYVEDERSQRLNSGDFLWRKAFFDWEIPHHQLWVTIRYLQNWNEQSPRSVISLMVRALARNLLGPEFDSHRLQFLWELKIFQNFLQIEETKTVWVKKILCQMTVCWSPK